MTEAKRILIVDDDKSLTAMLAELLQTEGYECDIAHNGSDALLQVKEFCPALVVLDVMMPGDDGVSTLRKLRQTSDVAVLMLTAMAEEEDRVQGLEAGADDYLAKPVVPRELVLRIQAILRRVFETSPVAATRTSFDAGPLFIEPQKHRTQLNGTELPLTGAEQCILEALARSPGDVVTRDQLTRFALGRELTPYDRAIDTHISHLRRKLDHADNDSSLKISSVRGSGYRLVIN